MSRSTNPHDGDDEPLDNYLQIPVEIDCDEHAAANVDRMLESTVMRLIDYARKCDRRGDEETAARILLIVAEIDDRRTTPLDLTEDPRDHVTDEIAVEEVVDEMLENAASGMANAARQVESSDEELAAHLHAMWKEILARKK